MIASEWPILPSPPTLTPRTLTLDAWLALDEDEPGEWVDGTLEGEMPGYLHEVVVGFLVSMFTVWGRPRGASAVASGLKFVLGPRRGRMPDVSVFLAGAKRPPREGGVHTPPSIAIEVVTPTPRDERRDRIEKANEYAAFGVKWYWLVDPALRSVEVWELGADGRYAQTVAAVTGVVDPVPGCDGLSLDIDALWREIDALPAE